MLPISKLNRRNVASGLDYRHDVVEASPYILCNSYRSVGIAHEELVCRFSIDCVDREVLVVRQVNVEEALVVLHQLISEVRRNSDLVVLWCGAPSYWAETLADQSVLVASRSVVLRVRVTELLHRS